MPIIYEPRSLAGASSATWQTDADAANSRTAEGGRELANDHAGVLLRNSHSVVVVVAARARFEKLAPVREALSSLLGDL
ncbi:MAG: hypothetical protein JNK47_24545 [Mesorhizobium sp.]|nr:hypothetical protein [Mesorhizobium sp.]MBL8580379.1 hypothetical protein [Mesorhizobium sp.]